MGEADRIRGALGRLLHSLFSRIDYLALYPARVVSQSGQAVDLRPDDSRLPALEAVPLNLGLPGVEVDVEPGARVLLGFAGGDPAKPRATLWESGSVRSMRVDAGVDLVVNGGSKAVARVDDTAACGSIQMLAVPSSGATAITFLYLSPSGTPSTIGTITLTTAGGSAVAGAASVTARIDSGAAKFHA